VGWQWRQPSQIGAAVAGGFGARSWYMAIVLGVIAGVVARFGYVRFLTGSVALWQIDAAIVRAQCWGVPSPR
jgi:hypothetical protein